ncbi:hypothetical protein [Streptomyces sp. NPDC001714]
MPAERRHLPENRSAGGLLINYYFEDRILYGSDAFWVEIAD